MQWCLTAYSGALVGAPILLEKHYFGFYIINITFTETCSSVLGGSIFSC
jgi:hypothetical protein